NGGGVYEKVLSQFLTVLVGGYRFSHLSWWGHGVEAIYAAFGVRWLPKATNNKEGVKSFILTNFFQFAS
ncbi:MAG: hypothetical protein J7L53_10965, partial [Deltaproteobacteria bacterium]|nr:hypothetical protein [Deltaproteobacteria bacterium]